MKRIDEIRKEDILVDSNNIMVVKDSNKKNSLLFLSYNKCTHEIKKAFWISKEIFKKMMKELE